MNDACTELIIIQTKKWITDVVVGCNFCPFAAKALKRNTVHYEVLTNATALTALEAVLALLRRLDNNDNIETSFLILPGSFPLFDSYLDLIDLAEKLLAKENYEGIYQVASFHPLYLFEGSVENDPANYTNRSVYPMLHLLREESIDKALENYKDPESIPGRNIQYAREKGLAYMKTLRDAL